MHLFFFQISDNRSTFNFKVKIQRKSSTRKFLSECLQPVNDDSVQFIDSSEISKDVLGNTTTINTTTTSGGSQVLLVISEGRGHARGEIGIAALDTNSPVLILCQISDNLHYSDTLSKIQLLNPSKILLPDTIFETTPLPKLIELIKESFRHIPLIPLQRRHFNDKYGLELITNFSSRKSKNILQVIARKYYCLSSASALLSYLKNVVLMNFGANCLRVEYQTRQGGMLIDSQTSARLELLYALSSDAKNKFSLFSVLNKCVTKIGQRHLRANILEPSCSIDFIRNRQEQIKVLMENEEVTAALKENLENFRAVDQLLKISCIVPAADYNKAIETNIQMAIQLKTCLEAIKPLCEVMKNTVSESFLETRQLLDATVYKEIIEKIDNIVQPDIHQNRLAQKHFLHLYTVRGGVNETIDYLRRLYSESISKINEYVTGLSEEQKLPLKLIFSSKLGHHLYFKNPQNLQPPEIFEVISRKGQNIYLTTAQLLAHNDTTRVISSNIIRMSNSIICDMLVSLANEIDSIHHLIGIVIDLDVVQSLTEVSSQENYCCPSFCQIMRIERAYHPMLEDTKCKDSVITNNVVSACF